VKGEGLTSHVFFYWRGVFEEEGFEQEGVFFSGEKKATFKNIRRKFNQKFGIG
jgi:hypothetical protein